MSHGEELFALGGDVTTEPSFESACGGTRNDRSTDTSLVRSTRSPRSRPNGNRRTPRSTSWPVRSRCCNATWPSCASMRRSSTGRPSGISAPGWSRSSRWPRSRPRTSSPPPTRRSRPAAPPPSTSSRRPASRRHRAQGLRDRPGRPPGRGGAAGHRSPGRVGSRREVGEGGGRPAAQGRPGIPGPGPAGGHPAPGRGQGDPQSGPAGGDQAARRGPRGARHRPAGGDPAARRRQRGAREGPAGGATAVDQATEAGRATHAKAQQEAKQIIDDAADAGRAARNKARQEAER